MSELLASLADLEIEAGEEDDVVGVLHAALAPSSALPVMSALSRREEDDAEDDWAEEAPALSPRSALPVVSASSRREAGTSSEDAANAPPIGDAEEDSEVTIGDLLCRLDGRDDVANAEASSVLALAPEDQDLLQHPGVLALIMALPRAELLIADAAQLGPDRPKWSGPIDGCAERSLEATIDLRHRARKDFQSSKNATLHRKPPKKGDAAIGTRRETLSTLRHERAPLLALTQNGEQPMGPQTMAAMLLAPPGTQAAWSRAEAAETEALQLNETGRPTSRSSKPGFAGKSDRSRGDRVGKAEGGEGDNEGEEAPARGVERPFRSSHSLQTYYSAVECSCDDWKISGL